MIIPNFFFDSWWPGLAIWIALYISDYCFTLLCARLYQRGVNKTIAFEGSFEITPYFQKDIDGLRIVSQRFIFALLLSCAWLVGNWWIGSQTLPQVYEFVLGAMILNELAIHIRHVRNLFLFRAITSGNAVVGRIEYSRPIILRSSSIELAAFAGLFGLVFLFTRSWFVLGGAFGTLS